jgi:hypothetical protein
MAVVMLLALSSAQLSLMAHEPSGQPDYVPSGPAAFCQEGAISMYCTGQDDGIREVGVEYVNDYPGTGSDLGLTDDDALSFYNRLGNCGWTRRFAWGNGNAWEEDWKRTAAGGTNNSWIDTVDFAYFTGHGYSDGIVFGVGGNTHDDAYLTTADCRLAWGDKDVEWVGLSSCLSMQTPASRQNWSWCMNGAHLILGFETVMDDVNHGNWFGYYVCQGWTMTQAWFKAADLLQSQGRVAGVLAEENVHFYDRYYNHTGGDTWDYDFYYWRHPVGSEPANYVNMDLLANAMPVFRTQPLSLQPGGIDGKWAKLGTAFGVSTTNAAGPVYRLTPLAGEEDLIRTSADGQLEMSEQGGLFAFTNQARLWMTPTLLATNAPMRILSPQEAITVANTFLKSNGLMPGDASLYEAVADTVAAAEVPSTTLAGKVRSVGDVVTTNTATQVIYSRKLTSTVMAAADLSAPQVVTFSVMGPGAKLKVYVDPAIPANMPLAQAANTAVIGGMGGWRALLNPTVNGPQAVEVISTMTITQAQKLLEQLETQVALNYVPLDYASRQVFFNTPAYFELPMGVGQAQLVPTYVFTALNTLKTGSVVTSEIYIPANGLYAPPLARIDPSSMIPPVVKPGDQLVLKALDATSNLSDVGFDPLLNFKLGTGDPLSLVYNWYHGSVTDTNKIGTGKVVTYTALTTSHDGVEVLDPVILEVRDTLKEQEPRVSQFVYDPNKVFVFLPVVLK